MVKGKEPRRAAQRREKDSEDDKEEEEQYDQEIKRQKTSDAATRTTLDPLVDIATAVPDIAKLAKTTVRLHPRAGKVDPRKSKMGGPIAWPKSKEWPKCDDCESKLVPVIQLCKEDVPEMYFPNGSDVFQLLWCANEECDWLVDGDPYVFFWKQEDLKDITTDIPKVSEASEELISAECQLFPERVIEYPNYESLPKSIVRQIKRSAELKEALTNPDYGRGEDSQPLDYYMDCLSVACGTKACGYPHWCQSPEDTSCEKCEGPMDLLVCIDSCEFDSASNLRWATKEEGKDITAAPTGLMLGDSGQVNVFICTVCPDAPTIKTFQCC